MGFKRINGLKIIDNLPHEAENFLREWFDSNDYIVAHTSGSTGKPKKIHLLKEDMRISARATNSFFSLNENSVLACPLSASYIAGKMMIVRAIEADAELYMEAPSNRPFQDVDFAIDFAAVVPSQLDFILTTQPYIKQLLIGGAPLDKDLEQRLTHYDFAAYLSYGMTETCSHIALRRIGEDDIYKAVNDISFDLDDRGCLIVDSTKMSFRRLITNDIVELSNAYSFRWLGRHDNVINSGGIKVFPEVIERKIATVIPEREFYISCKRHDKWGETVVLVIEGPSFPTDTINIKLRETLPPAERPSEIIFVEKFPRTSSGKIIRQKF